MTRGSRAALCVALGVAFSLGTAAFGWYWVHVIRSAPPNATVQRPTASGGTANDRVGATWYWEARETKWYTHYVIEDSESWLHQRLSNNEPSRVEIAGRLVESIQPGETLVTHIAYGFPWRCLRATVAINYTKPVEGRVRYITGKDIGWHDGGYPEEGALPIGPIWLGLFGDTAVYAIVLFGILETAALVMRYRRRRRGSRGLCACGYDRSGLAADTKCPECGLIPPGTATAAP